MSTIIRCDCGKEAYAWRVTRWGRDAVCRDCNHGYPHEGSFEPFVPWSPQTSEQEESSETDRQQLKEAIVLLSRWMDHPEQDRLLSDTYHFVSNNACCRLAIRFPK